MNTPIKIAIAAGFVCGFSAFASGAASAMPVASVGLAPATEEAHAVRVCSRGRCWWTYSGHRHGGWGGYGWRGGWRGPGWRGGWHGGWHGGRGWHGGWRGHGWHGGHGRWR